MPFINEYLNERANSNLTDNLRRVLGTFCNSVGPMAEEVKEDAQRNYRSFKTDLREVAPFAWAMADDISLSNIAEDNGFQNGMNYINQDQAAREDTLDQYYERLRNLDYRNFNFSCLSGQDNTEVQPNGLTSSENDVIKTVLYAKVNQLSSTRAKENEEYYLNRLSRLSPQERYKEYINEEYGTRTKDAIIHYLLRKNGYDESLGNENSEANIAIYNQINSGNPQFAGPLATIVGAQAMEQIYGYRMAMVNGEKNPPEPELKFRPHSSWNYTAADLDQNDQAYTMFTGVFPHLFSNMDKPLNDDISSQVFIDGVSLKDYCGNQVNDQMGKFANDKVYARECLKALFSGEHHVETTVRYMDKNGKMHGTLMEVKADLTLASNREVSSHSWFRRTFFNWGPFKIKTCKDKQAALFNNDTSAAKEARRNSIVERYHVFDETNNNPDKILFERNESGIVRDKNKIKSNNLPDFKVWLEDKATYTAEKNISLKEEFPEKVSEIAYHDFNDFKTVYLLIADNYGVGNAISTISNLTKTPSKVTKAQEKILNDIGHYGNLRISSNDKKSEVLNKTIEHFFRNGGVENSKGECTLMAMRELSAGMPQEKFVKAIKNLNEPTRLLNEKISELVKSYKSDPNARISPEDKQFITDRLIEQKVNVAFSDKLSKMVDGTSFNADMIRSEEVNTLIKYFGDKGSQAYKEIVQQVKEANKDTLFKSDNLKDVLDVVYNSSFKTPKTIRESIVTGLAAQKEKEMGTDNKNLQQDPKKNEKQGAPANEVAANKVATV
ncbi:hypothetical protein SAMN02910298_02583 [Pseudobutyrivibrio sp. YE44]|uniref:hypothetical protein n=1 Tax=Pseudobutyrivibrio sp. YE44 TaxID=1520802 RepID=UPI0008888C55|nr:hypothetical protein [Pseudobutyrivibrio sp. YE44]SDB50755.1 hypothetical protein SAMN02910298_02583 [Pseudobutyrivibrio sp. YE44]